MKNLITLCCLLFIFSCKAQDTATKKYANISATVLEKAVLAGGKLIRVKDFPSENISPRPVDVWLPENYSSKKKYAVLYMHDGQNLFDATTTWNKQEWMIDEVATKLMKEGITRDFIVVGIHNIPKIRWQDLYPEKAMDFLKKEDKEALYSEAAKNNFSTNLKGDEYLKFLVQELKPYIDATYSVYINKENTFVMGSSMGGLMSMYAVAEYPEVFAGAACVSTHWVGAVPKENNPLPEAIFSYLENNLPDAGSHKMYFDYGNQTLDQFYPKYAPKVDTIFKKGGYSDTNFKNLFFEGTNHSELSWQKRVHIPLTFLLKK
ncbi:alpha/beta hydrolase [Polaribacter aestuariivivens]|uniref:Alpha/beta hydrolase n=1 Tax=Polaribacter aestuariivivens TaxID=2304626 RepID=A0A5S3N8S0_9FLAO|nr:alpha/beta hydrolase-fold protein [Polaribacter aestuariivivens]TMM31512.1 alpha/beta hydrolase [Polaribacter aestuariivivens]